MTALLYEDAALIAVDKPPGALAVRGRLGAQEPSLLDALMEERREKLYLVHRLDRGTSGVLIFARTADAQRALGAQFEQGTVEKRYLALVRGEPPQAQFAVDVALVPARRGKSRPAAAGEGGKAARTRFTVLERLGGFALLEAAPETGRTHQIRVHLRYAGFPLAVDPLYGRADRLLRGEVGLEPPEAALLERTPLHCLSLCVAHPGTRAPLRIAAPVPADLAGAVEALRAQALAP